MNAMFTRILALGILYFAVSTQAATLFSTNATWLFRRGTNEASLPDITAWRAAAFNDSGFASAPAPFWYGDVRPGGTQLNDMLNTYSCIFLRKTFNVPSVAGITGLRFTHYIDDGFVAWLNGREIYRENVTGDALTTNTLAVGQPVDPAVFTNVIVTLNTGDLVAGDNVLAVQVFNTTLGSSDLGFDLMLESVVNESVPPTIVSFTPPAGSRTDLNQITVTFSEPVTGVDADDLSIAGNPATEVAVSGTTYTFTFAQPAYGEVPISWETSHGIKDLATTPNAFNAIAPGATWSYTLVDVAAPTIAARFPQPGTTVSALGQVEVTFSENVTGVNASDLLVNGQPATNVIAQPNATYLFQFAQPAEGPVEISFASGHGIMDLASVPNAFAGGSWNCTFDSSLSAGDLVITEISAANQSGLLDEDGEAQDWIEIYNRGNTAADLGGWSLSDDEMLPGLWVLPTKVLLPRQYLVVFASGKNRKAPSGANLLHANFTLANDGEFVGLFNSGSPRLLISGFGEKYPVQRNDYSYGTDADGNLRYFATPTPGTANGASTITGVVEPVHFSSTRGHYTQPFDLILSCPTPGAVIRYTRDGSEPTAVNGSPYAGALRLTGTTLLRAAAFRTGLLVSKVSSHSFFFGLTAANRSLPTLSILTHSNNLLGRTGIIGMSGGTGPPNNAWTATGPNDYYNPTNKGIEWEKPASVEYIDPADNSGFQVDAGLRVQGSDWTRPRYLPTSKFSYRLYFRGDYGSGRLEFPLMPTGVVNSFDQIVLRAGHNDETNPYITDELMRQLFADQGQVSVHGTFVNFWLNGVLKLYYNPTERVEEGFLQSWHGGGKDWDIITVGSVAQGGDTAEWNALRTYVSGQNVQLPSVYQEIERRMDLTNFVDYLLVNTYGATWDWPHNNWRAARERAPGGRFRFYVWDAEGAFGFTRSTPTFDSFSTTDSGLLPPSGTAEIPRFYQGLVVSPEFRLLWADRVQKHFFNNGALTDTNITQRFLELRAKVLPVITGFDNKYLNTWIPQRRAPLLTQYIGYGLMASSNAPVFSKHGGLVPLGFNLSISNLTGTIYYTLDGSDPRVKFSGAVSNSAIAYTGPIALDQNVLIRARTLSGTNWSAVSEATFEVGTQGSPLRITEINYNPVGGSVHEFIELQNVTGAPVDLSGCYFDEGINFTFKAGSGLAGRSRLILANNTDTNSFAARYPGISVAGYFAGNLNNSGERITLKDRNGNIICSVDYSDRGGWPTSPDGGGASLEVTDVLGDADDAANWHASESPGGSPGGENSEAPSRALIRINEVLAENGGVVDHGGTFPDYVELYNPELSSINLAGWSLTDDSNARKFVFPAVGSTVAGRGYLTVWCDNSTNTTPGFHAGFALNRSGDTVYLYDPATNRYDAFTYGLQLTNYSVGLFDADPHHDREPIRLLFAPSPNAENGLPAPLASPSALSINEWLANSPPGVVDWIELHNTAAQPVALQGLYLSNTSSVHRITSLSFIPAFGFAQLFADEAVGADHLDFKLAAGGGAIVLSDTIAQEIQRVTYTNSTEALTRGRFPDGSATFVNFSGSASPGASNYVNTYVGAVLNEVLARSQTAVTNDGRVADFIELNNPTASLADLSGMSLSVNGVVPGQWIFPPGTTIPAGGFLVLPCDGSRPASTSPGIFNIGRSLDGDSGGVYLFNPAGQLVNSVDYGFQIADRSIGLVGGQWRLLAAPTPGAANSAAAALGSNSVLRFNEWMASPRSGSDWFEIFNPTNAPIDLGGLYLTDDPSIVGQIEFRIPALSFIGSRDFVQFIADADPEQGRNHAGFSLDGSGETLRLYSVTNATNFVVIDSVTFSTQVEGVSEGRLPDGQAGVVSFPGSATPSESNYQIAPGIIINEILAHVDGGFPLEDAVEIHNTSASAAAIGGWYLSNGQDDFKKFRVADGTVIPAGGFVVLYQNQFSNATPGSFTFSGAYGGEAWLSQADAGGNLTGIRTGAKFGASEHGVSLGRITTTVGTDYSALSARTFGSDSPSTVAQFRTGTGLPNAAPKVGPIVINEIMYNPVSGVEEYIELQNISGSPVQLARVDAAFPATTNTWRISGGVDYSFPVSSPISSAVPAGAYFLVVDFDPANPATLAAFRGRYGIPVGVPVFGPFSGKLDNAGESISLLRPDETQPLGAPDAGYVPYVRVDRVDFGDSAPWPSGDVDGGGLSLQRKGSSLYGNEPLNWVASAPTPGAANGAGITPVPVITVSPQSQLALEAATVQLTAAATGTGPLRYQWRFNGSRIDGATNAALAIPYITLIDDGAYDCLASNPGGCALTAAARLTVVVPPVVVIPPVNVVTNRGSNVVFSVAARGSAPLRYQWRLNGVSIPGQTNVTIARTNIQFADDGEYDVLITNPYATTIASARLTVLIPTTITLSPLDVNVVTGATFTVSVVADGNPLPFGYEWRQGSAPLASNTVNARVSFMTFTAPTNIVVNQSWRVVIKNLANINPGASVQFRVSTFGDTDLDGIPDFWETLYGFNPGSAADRDLDFDGDGMSNRDEYFAGTNPTNAASVLRVTIPSAVPSGATVKFEAATNRTYSVQFTDILGTAPWSKLGDFLARTNSRVEVIVDPEWKTNRHYRVVTPRLP